MLYVLFYTILFLGHDDASLVFSVSRSVIGIYVANLMVPCLAVLTTLGCVVSSHVVGVYKNQGRGDSHLHEGMFQSTG